MIQWGPAERQRDKRSLLAADAVLALRTLPASVGRAAIRQGVA
jgi:hypothetical protein